MKACVIQPPYSMDLAYSDEYFAKKLEYLAACDASMDTILTNDYNRISQIVERFALKGD